MPTDPDAVLALLKDPNVESQQVAEATGAPRDAVARCARIVSGLGRAKGEDLASLPPVLALAVVRAAFGAGRGDLLAAAAGSASRDVAKEAKRCLHLLRSRGVAVPQPARPPPPAPAAEPEPVVPCYASSVDGHGERAVWLARSVPGKGIEVAQAVVSDVHGVLELQVGVLGRKEYRSFAKDVAARGRTMGIVEVERELALALVADARRRNDAAGKPPPDGTDAWLARLGPARPLSDPSAELPELPPEEEQAAVADGARLHDLPLLRGWLADEDALRALAQKLDEIAVSPLYLDDRQRAEQSVRTVAEALRSYFDDGERRARWASRLGTVAAHLARSGDAVHARIAGASARALARGDDPARIPFARMLVEKAFPPEAATPSPPATGAGEPLIVAPR
jgi:hypothetical protein